jgi:hypothetical protein
MLAIEIWRRVSPFPMSEGQKSWLAANGFEFVARNAIADGPIPKLSDTVDQHAQDGQIQLPERRAVADHTSG